jgi:hypothetical protein
MNFVEKVISQMNETHKPQRKFMLDFFLALFMFVGRATMTNLSRYGVGSVRRLSRWKKHVFDFVTFNLIALEEQKIISQHEVVLVFDPTFIPKSGKKTHGLDKFYNASHSKVEKGLEASLLGLADLNENTCYALNVTQTPANLSEEESRIDFYVGLIQKYAPPLVPIVKSLVVDGGFGKKKFVNGVAQTGLEVIGKLRHDSRLRYLFNGVQKRGRGRPKQYDGKVDYNDLSRMKKIYLKEEKLWLYSSVVNHIQFERNIRVVILKKEKQTGKNSHVILFSTNLDLNPIKIYQLYKARFQIEFVIRDAKQHTGFSDFQMRDQKGIDFHLNASVTAVNLLRLEDRYAQNANDKRVISLYSWKRRKYNEKLIKLIFSELENELTEEKKAMLYEKYREFGTMAA